MKDDEYSNRTYFKSSSTAVLFALFFAASILSSLPTAHAEREPVLIYALFNESNVGSGLTNVSLMLDVRSDRFPVESVDAIIIDPSGEKEVIPMALSSGTDRYGTWIAEYHPDQIGEHKLVLVRTKTMIDTFTHETEGIGLYAADTTTDLVYAIFTQGVLKTNATQTIMADAKSPMHGVDSVFADIETPSGQRELLELSLDSGSAYYGTWKANMPNLTEGQYTLKDMLILSNGNSHLFTVEDMGFYAAEEPLIDDAELEIVFALLNESVVEKESIVELLLDAKDKSGIDEITAHIRVSTGIESSEFEVIDIDLELIEGTELYGTWKGYISADLPDSTYELLSITVAGNGSQVSHPQQDRSFYVQPEPQSARPALEQPGMFMSFGDFEKLIREPYTPALLGMLAMLAIFTVSHSIISRDSIKRAH